MKILIPFLIVFTITSCKNTSENITKEEISDKKENKKHKIKLDTANFGTAINLSEFPKTEFLPTLESTFNKNKNSIYAASLLFAWNEIRETLKHPIDQIESKQLKEINNSTTYKNVLLEEEYLTQVEIIDSTIKASAYLKKLLPFVTPLSKKNTPIKFNNKVVENFGFYGEEYEHDILYYSNDSDFSIRLNPKNREHEIILVLSNFKSNSIIKEWHKLSVKRKEFKSNRNAKNAWKHDFQHDDKVSIPILNFNLKTNYSNTEGSLFYSHNQLYLITQAFQQIAFNLDEKGAKVESYAEIGVEAAAEHVIEERPTPKSLIFNQPFIVFLKRRDSDTPYFVAYISNTELMEEFKIEDKK